MRYGGMRISDALTLTTDRIDGKRLFLHTLKTGVPLYTVLRDAEDARRPLHGPCTRFTFGAGSLGLKVLPDCGRSAPRNFRSGRNHKGSGQCSFPSPPRY